MGGWVGGGCGVGSLGIDSLSPVLLGGVEGIWVCCERSRLGTQTRIPTINFSINYVFPERMVIDLCLGTGRRDEMHRTPGCSSSESVTKCKGSLRNSKFAEQ